MFSSMVKKNQFHPLNILSIPNIKHEDLCSIHDCYTGMDNKFSPATLGIMLSKIHDFSDVKHKNEQYMTPAQIAADLLYNAYDDVYNKTIADLGAGTGMLSIAAALMGAKVIAYEQDKQATTILKKNCEQLDVQDSVTIYNKDITIELKLPTVDCIIMNPPFGTKQKGIDITFLEIACKSAPIVWSMHKTSTIDFVQTKVEQFGKSITYKNNVLFPIKNTHQKHNKEIKNIEVTIIRCAS